jgi:CubicO group peptidase (beta-lactamase class C family)
MHRLFSVISLSLVLSSALRAQQPPNPSQQTPPQEEPAQGPPQQSPFDYLQNPNPDKPGLPSTEAAGDKIDLFIRPYLQMGDFSGCILVAKYARILTRKCYGGANYELRVVNTPTTRFHIASLTKPFTAAAIVILAQQGKLHYSDAVSRYIPNLPGGDKITIRDLLEHTSGIPSFYSLPEYDTIKFQPIHYEDLFAIMRKHPLEFEPGTKSSYSDTGYVFLAYIIEKVSGQPYEQFVNQEIFVPFGMKHSGTFSDTALIPERASGYQPWVSDPPVGQPDSPINRLRIRNAPFSDRTITTGSGSLYSTLDDLYLFYQGLQSKRLFDIQSFEYPYGWGKREFQGKEFLEQSGRDPGYVARIAAFLNYNIVVIVLSNVEVGADAPIAEGLETIAFGSDPPSPPQHFFREETAAALKPYEGRYQIAPNSIMDVRVAGNHLFLRGPGGDYLPLDATGRDAFFFRQLYAPVVFERDPDGKVDGLLWGGSATCKKVPGEPVPWN